MVIARTNKQIDGIEHKVRNVMFFWGFNLSNFDIWNGGENGIYYIGTLTVGYTFGNFY